MAIKLAINEIRNNLPANVKLIIVTKKQSSLTIMEVYQLGERHFGENRVQEIVPKSRELPEDIRWHMIGHLQTNKVKYLAKFVDTIHSIDSLKLLQKVNTEAEKHNRTIRCLLQIHIARESGKYGFSYQNLKEILSQENWKKLNNISIIGLMGMATFTNDKKLVRAEFKQLKFYFKEINNRFFESDDNFSEISMGMSQDYPIAVEEGATMIRIGSLIFNNP